MRTSSTSGIEFQLSKASGSGGSQPPSAIDARLVLYILLLVPGIFFSLLPLSVYPPLDTRLAMAFMLCAYLLPWALLLLGILRKRRTEGRGRLRAAFTYSSLALVLFGVLLIINGGLDRFPPTELKTTVVRKVDLAGRHGTEYHIIVSSWRPGRNLEDFTVVQPIFNRAVVGKTVTVKVHHGFFGLPWYGKISPE